METLSLDEVKEAAKATMLEMLQHAKTDLTRGDFIPTCTIIYSDHIELAELPGEAMNSKRRKVKLFRMIRERAITKEAQCVIYLVDSFLLDVNVEGLSLERRQELDDLQLEGATLDDLSLLGFGQRIECITAVAQYPDATCQICVQPYTRAEDGTITYGALDDKGTADSGGEISVWPKPMAARMN